MNNCQPCPCIGEPNPLLRFNSEAPDVPTEIGLGFGPNTPPPLGSTWNNPTAFVALDVLVTNPADRETAQLLAESEAFQQAASGWTAPNGFPVQTYRSASQFVTENCPDGSQFTFGVIAGLFTALTQAEADAEALSYCQRQITLHKVCLFGEFPVLCLGQYSSVQISAQGMTLDGVEENLWALTGGVLPPGMSFNGGSLASESVSITGTPTTPGTYAFSVQVTTPQGDFMEKSFSLTIVGVTNADLPPGTIAVPYSFQLAWTGFQDPLFTCTDLPPGLSLSASGLLSGTPTQAGAFDITIGVLDVLADCSVTLALEVTAISPGIIPNATQLVPYAVQFTVAGSPAAVFSSVGSLPPGLALSASGLLSGSPTVNAFGGYSFVIQAQTAPGVFASESYSMNVGSAVFSVAPNVVSGILVNAYFNSGGTFPPGVYSIQYVTGALEYQHPNSNWAINLVSNQRNFNLIVGIPIAALFEFPTPVFQDYASPALAEAANAGANITLTLNEVNYIGMQFADLIGTPGVADSPSPTFSLTRIA